jgi:hypothetical protein
MSVIETVLRCDTERSELLEEEARLLAILSPGDQQAEDTAAKPEGPKKAAGKKGGKPEKSVSADPNASSKLEKVGSTPII